MITSDEIKRRLWNGANELRGSMDASRYKDYMLGLMFYKFLSDKTLASFQTISGMKNASVGDLLQAYEQAYSSLGDSLRESIQRYLGYYVAPEYLYQTWLRDIQSGDFEVQKVADSLNHFERTVVGADEGSDFKGLFSSSTLDLSDTALGNNLNARSKNIKALILLFADLNMVDLQKGDILGDAYEYLIGQFAMESGKKAGEFYTQREVSEVMAQIVAKTTRIESIYDPTVGSGSLLLTVGKHLNKDRQKQLHYYGQEMNTATYNLCRMNLLLHNVRPEQMTVKNGDTLAEDWPEDPEHPNEGVQFDAVVMNPPYSLKNWNRSDLKVSDPRFEIAGTLPPSSKGDFAFLLHGLFHLGQQGTMAILLPHGVLFRAGSEGEIRKRLLEKNYIDAIIGLPSNLFTNTGIPVVILVLKKNRPLGEPVLFVDASLGFTKKGKQNALREKDIARIVDTFTLRQETEGYSCLASLAQIKENDYNLNIPRYVSSREEEIPHDVDAHLHGGIPLHNIAHLKVLSELVPDVLQSALSPLRDGYVELSKPIDTLTEEVLNHEGVIKMAEEVRRVTEEYVQEYWEKLRSVNPETNLGDLREQMLVDAKQILTQFPYVDTYDGYQIVAEAWNRSLERDTEQIAAYDFYSVARSREPNMVTKGSGSNRREEQDGWNGTLIPNEAVERLLFVEQRREQEERNDRVQQIDAELSEWVEDAKDEDSEKGIVLAEALKKDSEGEPEDAFEKRSVLAEIKKYDRGQDAYEWLRSVERLLTEKAALNREIREMDKTLKVDVQERIGTLTEEEIDALVFEKWFGNTVEEMIALSQAALQKELKTLQQLQERYQDTLDSLDREIQKAEEEWEEFIARLVVTK